MILGTAVASLGIFLSALWWSGVIRVASDAVATTQGAVATMRDDGLNDRERERAIQRASLRLVVDFASILARALVAIAASLVPIWLAAASGLATAERVFDFLSGWEAGLIATALAAVAYGVRRRPWRTS